MESFMAVVEKKAESECEKERKEKSCGIVHSEDRPRRHDIRNTTSVYECLLMA